MLVEAVNQDNTITESSFSLINLKPKSHASMRPWRTAPNWAILLVVIPILRENLDIHELELSRSRPLALALPRLSKALPSVFSLVNGSVGAIHLII